jgi:hypothetical protein
VRSKSSTSSIATSTPSSRRSARSDSQSEGRSTPRHWRMDSSLEENNSSSEESSTSDSVYIALFNRKAKAQTIVPPKMKGANPDKLNSTSRRSQITESSNREGIGSKAEVDDPSKRGITRSRDKLGGFVTGSPHKDGQQQQQLQYAAGLHGAAVEFIQELVKHRERAVSDMDENELLAAAKVESKSANDDMAERLSKAEDEVLNIEHDEKQSKQRSCVEPRKRKRELSNIMKFCWDIVVRLKAVESQALKLIEEKKIISSEIDAIKASVTTQAVLDILVSQKQKLTEEIRKNRKECGEMKSMIDRLKKLNDKIRNRVIVEVVEEEETLERVIAEFDGAYGTRPLSNISTPRPTMSGRRSQSADGRNNNIAGREHRKKPSNRATATNAAARPTMSGRRTQSERGRNLIADPRAHRETLKPSIRIPVLINSSVRPTMSGRRTQSERGRNLIADREHREKPCRSTVTNSSARSTMSARRSQSADGRNTIADGEHRKKPSRTRPPSNASARPTMSGRRTQSESGRRNLIADRAFRDKKPCRTTVTKSSVRPTMSGRRTQSERGGGNSITSLADRGSFRETPFRNRTRAPSNTFSAPRRRPTMSGRRTQSEHGPSSW